MNICMNYQKNGRYNEEVKEFTIAVNEPSKLLDVIDFLKLYGDRKINIDISNLAIKEDAFSTLKTLSMGGKDISFRIGADQISDLATFNELNLKCFLNIRVSDWDTLNSLVRLGVSEIYIAEDLCFALGKVQQVIKDKNIRLRTYANVAQIKNYWWNKNITDTFKGFFIRPEDLGFYEDIFGSVEFYGPADRQDVLYKIYAKDRHWYGDLREIIIGLNEEIDNRCLLPMFAMVRATCEKKCIKGSKCQICERSRELIDAMKENNLEFKKKKQEDE